MLVILGVLLAGGAGAFTGLVIAYNTSGGPKYAPEIFGQTLPTLNTLGVFCLGAGLALIFSLGLWLIISGARHRAHRPEQGQMTTRDATGVGGGLGAGRPQPS